MSNQILKKFENYFSYFKIIKINPKYYSLILFNRQYIPGFENFVNLLIYFNKKDSFLFTDKKLYIK